MQDAYNSSVISPVNNNQNNEPTILQTDVGAKDGQQKCPKCGSTDIETNTSNGKLRCNFCRYEFDPLKVAGVVTDLEQLQGQILGSGAQDIVADTQDVLTFKCSSCGAEVVIDTSSALQARCHWCRNTLSVNQQIPNGSIPDVVLPFNINKETAQIEIEKFVGKRKFFVHPKFKEEFTTNNIMGVYFPYMLVDVNTHASFIGQGEKQTRKYYLKNGDNQKIYYDADLYQVQRDFDLTINGLSVESNSVRLNTSSVSQTNNIINSVMPFDIENCVKYNANYLKGFTSERRDTNVEQLKGFVDVQCKDIARFKANETLKEYDRGVTWSSQELTIKGQLWQAAYLPIWLYSYQEVKSNQKTLHYVAVNARTKETMGSIPLHMPKLIAVSLFVELIGLMAMLFVDWDYSYLFLLSGIFYFILIFNKYRNFNARHTYENDTKTNMTNLNKVDNFIQSKTRLTNSMMTGANNKRLEGKFASNKVLDSFAEQNSRSSVINKNTDTSRDQKGGK